MSNYIYRERENTINCLNFSKIHKKLEYSNEKNIFDYSCTNNSYFI